jgi:hypothetical protein
MRQNRTSSSSSDAMTGTIAAWRRAFPAYGPLGVGQADWYRVAVTADASFTEEELVCTAGERELLEGFLGYHRQVVRGKVRGLSEEDARRRLVPSSTRRSA